MDSTNALMIAVVVIVVFVALVAAQAKNSDRKQVYGRLARRFNGTCVSGGFFSHPSVRFRHAGAPVLVDIYSTGDEDPTYYTQVHLPWVDRHFRCEVYPEGFFSRLGKLIGMEDIEIGAPGFDETSPGIVRGEEGEKHLEDYVGASLDYSRHSKSTAGGIDQSLEHL